MNPYHHSLSSVKKFGGRWQDYQAIHHWFDETKAHYADFRHRSLRHHSLGIFECEKLFGPTLELSNGTVIPTRLVAEQHVLEDCGFVPTVQDWLKHLQPEVWMRKVAKKPHEIV